MTPAMRDPWAQTPSLQILLRGDTPSLTPGPPAPLLPKEQSLTSGQLCGESLQHLGNSCEHPDAY